MLKTILNLITTKWGISGVLVLLVILIVLVSSIGKVIKVGITVGLLCGAAWLLWTGYKKLTSSN